MFFGPADPAPNRPKPIVDVFFDWDEDCWMIDVVAVNRKGKPETFRFKVDN